MWDRKLIKGNAKRVLSRNYWIPFFVCLLVALISGDFNVGNFSGSAQYQFNIEGFSLSTNLSELLPITVPFYLVALGVFAIVVAIVIQVFLINPLRVGKARYFIMNIEEQAEIGEIFKVFTNGNYLNIVKIMTIMDIKIILWTLCLIIPGAIKQLEYTAIPYLLAEDASLSTSDVFARSRAMTSGEKFEIFVLHLSFIGWLFLGGLAFGIGVLFVNPYIEATFAELYYSLKQKEFV